jgi:predicted polyphosphate/ATP-dependent NAD kinase
VNKAKSRLGLIINPVAGLGGRVGLKGSDGLEIQQKALALGAVPQAVDRTIQALEALVPFKETLEIITYPGEMGGEPARDCGFTPQIIGSIQPGATTPQDTILAAKQMERLGVDLILFAGGDGTARDIFNAVAERVPVLGIPAGVKIHSAVFGINPRQAGALAGLFLRGQGTRLQEAEVMDVDEEAVRAGRVSARLYGYLRVPYRRNLVQTVKSGTSPGEDEALHAIASDIAESMHSDSLYILGPGTTTRAITNRLGLEKTLIGVDVLKGYQLVGRDVNEAQLLELLNDQSVKVIVTPIGGQRYLFGRGNQQISPRVLRSLGTSEARIKDNLLVVSTPGKIHSFNGRPLLVDTGDPEVDQLLRGYIHIITGYKERIIYKVSNELSEI